jgi:HNH endonuclease
MDLRQKVAERAQHCCEYCRLPERWTSLPFQLDHVVAEKHDGETSLENLAYACLHCNSFKGPNIAGHDSRTGDVVRLFNPRRDRWDEHFEWDGPSMVARTAIGRITIAVLRTNLPYRLAVRASLIDEGLFP